MRLKRRSQTIKPPPYKNASESTIYAGGRSMTQDSPHRILCARFGWYHEDGAGRMHTLPRSDRITTATYNTSTLFHHPQTCTFLEACAGHAALPLPSLDLTMRSLAPSNSRIRISMPSHTTPHPTPQYRTPEIYQT